MISFVLDASVAISWFIEDETAKASSAIDLLRHGRAIVPAIWTWEVANALMTAERRVRLSSWENTAILQKLFELPIDVDSSTQLDTLLSVSVISREHDLSVYDGAYLELAIRHQLPLATNDTKLIKAARKSSVKTIS